MLMYNIYIYMFVRILFMKVQWIHCIIINCIIYYSNCLILFFAKFSRDLGLQNIILEEDAM
jgi:hypothetical protein